jgi:hypothetical protein
MRKRGSGQADGRHDGATPPNPWTGRSGMDMDHSQRIFPSHQRGTVAYAHRLPNNAVHLPPRIAEGPKCNILLLRHIGATTQGRIENSTPNGGGGTK